MAKCIHGRARSFSVGKSNYDATFANIIEGICPKCSVKLVGNECPCCDGYFAAQQSEGTDPKTGKHKITKVIDQRPQVGV